MDFTLDHGYLAAFLLGFGYALISGALNLVAGALHGHGHAGGHTGPVHGHAGSDDHAAVGHGPVEAGHDAVGVHGCGHHAHHATPAHDTAGAHSPDLAESSAAFDGALHFSPISPVVISMFLCAFGAAGLTLSRVLHLPAVLSLPIAAASAFAVAGCVFCLFFTVFRITQASSEARVLDLTGLEGEVITPIPAHGLGEIAYVSRGTRYTGPSRSDDGRPHATGAGVIISRVTGATFCVIESVEAALRRYDGLQEGGDSTHE